MTDEGDSCEVATGKGQQGIFCEAHRGLGVVLGRRF